MSRGRPMKGAVVRTATGYRAEVPVHRGARKRMRRTLPTRSAANAWLKEVRRAHEAGRCTPEPGAVPGTVAGPVAVGAATATAPKHTGGTQRSAGPQVAAAPAPDEGATTPARQMRAFLPAAQAWLQEFRRFRRAKAGRRSDVESAIANHLVPFMARNNFTAGSDVTREAYVEFLVSMVNGESGSLPGGRACSD